MADKPNSGGKPISEEYARMLANEEARHAAEKEALISEFTEQLKAEWTPEDIKNKVEELLPEAYASMRYLINNADSESVRASLIKYIFGVALQSLAPAEGSADADEDFKKLLGDLAKTKKT